MERECRSSRIGGGCCLISFRNGSERFSLRAAGSNALACFRLGEGPFGAGQLNACLAVVVKEQNSRGGNVVPVQLVNMRQFQDDLAATCKEWVIDET